jgi:hypothetical protein
MKKNSVNNSDEKVQSSLVEPVINSRDGEGKPENDPGEPTEKPLVEK